METKIKLTKDMSVYGTNEEKLGDVKKVVVDPTTSQITHIVIAQGFVFTTDKVLSVGYIQRQNNGALYVDRPAEELELRDYEVTFYVNELTGEVSTDKDTFADPSSVIPTTVYFYPPMTTRQASSYYWGMPDRFGNDPIKMIKRINVPEGSVVVPEGAKVYSHDGDHVGDVHSVHMDANNNRLTHFIISQGLLFTDYKLIPTFWIEEVNEGGIHLHLETKQLEELPAYEAETA